MKTYWQFIMANYRGKGERFTCTECEYDSMVHEVDRDTVRYDCVFCGWGCFHDHLGWWHTKTSEEWEQEAYEEQFG